MVVKCLSRLSNCSEAQSRGGIPFGGAIAVTEIEGYRAAFAVPMERAMKSCVDDAARATAAPERLQGCAANRTPSGPIRPG
jgi:hypothetical protein